MIIIKVLGLILLLILVPCVIGLIPNYYLNRQSHFDGILILGYLLMLAILELVGIPIVVFSNEGAYRLFLFVFGLALLISCVAGIYLNRRNLKRHFSKNEIADRMKELLAMSVESKIYLVLILICVAFQLVMFFVFASMDADDFYYNAQALTSQQFGTMYRIDANTGRSSQLDIRHAMALFPMWQSFVSSITGVHVAIVAHKAVPMVLVPMSYFLVFKISELLFVGKREQQFMFVLLMNVWRVFGFVSYYTTETFFLLRTWQGKSFAGNIILPAIIWIFLKIHRTEKSRYYLILAMCILASGSSSSLAVMLSCILTGLLSIVFLIYSKSWKRFLYELMCCIPGVIYILIYMIAG